MADLFGEWELAQAQGLEGNLGDGVNLGGLPKKLPRNKNINAGQQIQQAEQERQQARRQGGFATGNPMYNVNAVAGMAGAMGAQQGNALQNMISQTTDAWRDEHDSRVSQNREARRMQHEKDIEQMRIEAMLKRLEMERQQFQGPQPRVSGEGFAIY
jgi:hypothetical protein